MSGFIYRRVKGEVEFPAARRIATTGDMVSLYKDADGAPFSDDNLLAIIHLAPGESIVRADSSR